MKYSLKDIIRRAHYVKADEITLPSHGSGRCNLIKMGEVCEHLNMDEGLVANINDTLEEISSKKITYEDGKFFFGSLFQNNNTRKKFNIYTEYSVFNCCYVTGLHNIRLRIIGVGYDEKGVGGDWVANQYSFERNTYSLKNDKFLIFQETSKSGEEKTSKFLTIHLSSDTLTFTEMSNSMRKEYNILIENEHAQENIRTHDVKMVTALIDGIKFNIKKTPLVEVG